MWISLILLPHTHTPSLPGVTNDLHRFDTLSLEWREIVPAAGQAPMERCSHGFAAAGTSLYVFGGVAGAGGEKQSPP
jgi:hypothetical protein